MMIKYKLPVLGIMMILLALLIAGCTITSSNDTTPPESSTTTSPGANELASAAEPQQSATPSNTSPPTTEPVSTDPASTATTINTPETEANNLENPLPKPQNELDSGEYHWSQLLARDSIAPIYDPQFVPAAQAPYDDEELVIGVEINGQAKAYAIGPLNSREMVNDVVGGTPVLVTW